MKALETLKRTLRDLTLSQQVGMGAAAIVVLLAAAAFFTWVSEPSYTVLYSDIDQAQLSQVIDSLDAAGVPYRLEGGGSRVMVPQSYLPQSYVPQAYRVAPRTYWPSSRHRPCHWMLVPVRFAIHVRVLAPRPCRATSVLETSRRSNPCELPRLRTSEPGGLRRLS